MVAPVGLPEGLGTLVAGRFRLVDELGRGGVGVVYRALDERTHEEVALKRLIVEARTAEGQQRFEHEYRTLRQLDHPFIIRVYEFGVDDEGPYYTMELLGGSDLRSLPPTSIPQLCRYIRDIASSLALIHARRLIHRDISPRNIRTSSEGRAKLLDFGALTPFGVPPDVIGTPPCVPPEALAGVPLDQRADLFALGALSYFVLTGHHAFPARRLSDLSAIWHRPVVRPADRRADVPEALDDLVMSMLSLEPLARPASAADVIERLNIIADLEPERLDIQQAYLEKPPFVGAPRSVARLTAAWKRTRRGKGAAVIVAGGGGSGKSRLLDELAMTAQLGGSVVLSARGTGHRAAYSVVQELTELAFARVPQHALAAARETGAHLLHVVPSLKGHFSGIEPAEIAGDAQERRAALQNAVLGWCLRLSKEAGSLVLLIDDIEAVDEASAAALAALSFETSDHPLLLAVSASSQSLESDRLLRALTATSDVVRLSPLKADETGQIIRTLFGDVPHCGRVAQWIHERSGGVPQAVLDAAEDLVRQEVARYVDGAWVLPQELPRGTEGERSSAAKRVEALEPKELELLAAMSVHRGAMKLDACRLLSDDDDEQALFDSLQSLLAEGVLRRAGEKYVFSHEAVRRAAYDTLSATECSTLHSRLGHHLLSESSNRSPTTELEAGWQLMKGGETDRGVELLISAGRALIDQRTAVGEAASALEAALHVYREQGRTRREQLDLLIPLATAGYLWDRKYADRYGEEAFDQLIEVTGLAAARKASRLLRPKAALAAGTAFSVARLRFNGKPASELKKLYVNLVIVSITLVGVAGITLDSARSKRIVDALEPLSGLPPSEIGSLLYRYCRLIYLTSLGREPECTKLGRELSAELQDPTRFRQLPQATRESWRAGLLLGLATYDCYRNDDTALKTAEALDAIDLSMAQMFADQVRMIYHAYRGELDRAQAYREDVERYAVQGGTTWQAEVIMPATMILPTFLTGDLVGLKRVATQLETLSRDIPSLSLYRDLCRAHVKALRGQAEEAVPELESIVASMSPRQATAWQAVRSSLAEVYIQCGRAGEARELLERTRVLLTPEDRQFAMTTILVERVYARALSACGEHEPAARLLDELIDEYGRGTNPLYRGQLHAERALVALSAGDAGSFAEHASAARRLYRSTDNPALIVQGERLARLGATRLGRAMDGTERASLPPIASMVHEALSECASTEARAQRALGLLVADTGGTAGCLYLISEKDLRLAARVDAPNPPEDAFAQLQLQVTQFRAIADATPCTETDSLAADSITASGETNAPKPSQYRPVLLSTQVEGRARLVAAALVWSEDGTATSAPSPTLAGALASGLL